MSARSLRSHSILFSDYHDHRHALGYTHAAALPIFHHANRMKERAQARLRYVVQSFPGERRRQPSSRAQDRRHGNFQPAHEARDRRRQDHGRDGAGRHDALRRDARVLERDEPAERVPDNRPFVYEEQLAEGFAVADELLPAVVRALGLLRPSVAPQVERDKTVAVAQFQHRRVPLPSSPSAPTVYEQNGGSLAGDRIMQGKPVSFKERHGREIILFARTPLESVSMRSFVKIVAVAAVCVFVTLTARVAALADGNPQPYATFIAGATPQHGLFTIWHKDGKVYLELTADQLDRDFVQTIVPGTGLGGWFVVWGNTDHLPTELVRFTRVGNQVAILWPNPNFVAPSGTPAARAVDASFPHSIVGLASIAAVDDKSGTVVFDASPFLGDMLDLHDVLKQFLPITDPQGDYRLDADKSYLGITKAFPRNVVIEAQQDWSTDTPTVVDTVPDARNIQMRVVYNIAEPPGDADYMPRYADDRVGIYDDVYLDFGNDAVRERQLRYLVRWNLQPSDPSKPISPAKHPMVFYLSNTIPVAYRPAIKRAVLTWNQAFERIGISDALQVRDQPDDPNWDADDIRYNVIRWVTEARSSFGADSQTLYDPRTGQEFRTGILVAADSARYPHLEWKWFVDPVRYGRVTDPMPQSFLDDSFLSEILHETGHNLGMQHNFIGSMAYTAKELQDPAFTSRYGITSTVMEYAPLNLWPKPYGQGSYFQTVLGPYDYYAMKFAYARIPGARTPDEERPTLEKWAQAWSDPKYRYGSDEDVSWGNGHAADPRIEQGDLTNDPLSWCTVQLQMDENLLHSLSAHFPEPGHAYDEERAVFGRIVGNMRGCTTTPVHYIGGQYLSRAHRGDPGADSPIVPTPRQDEQRAFSILDRYLFSDTNWKLPADLLDKLEYSEWAGYGYVEYPGYGNLPSWAYDPPDRHYESIPAILGGMEDNAIAQLFNPLVLQRIVDNPSMATAHRTMTIDDLFAWMHSSVYSELEGRRVTSISLLRRNLQASYEHTLIGLVTAPQQGTPDDAQSLARAELARLVTDADSALKSGSLDGVTRAHLMTMRARAQAALSKT